MEKKSITIVEVQGSFSGHSLNGIMEWICPITNQEKYIQGEFAYDEEGWWHDVYDQDDNYLYTVIA